jgi:hypothetical protein
MLINGLTSNLFNNFSIGSNRGLQNGSRGIDNYDLNSPTNAFSGGNKVFFSKRRQTYLEKRSLDTSSIQKRCLSSYGNKN